MKQAGFVQAVKSRGKYYFYVRIAYRDENKKKRNKNIAALGQKDKAISLLKSWLSDPLMLPGKLSKYSEDDLKEWIKYVESK